MIGTQNRTIIACLVLAIAGIVSTAPAISATSSSSETTATEGPATEGPATEGPATEGPATEGPATEGPATEGPATEGPATEGPATEGPATEGPATEGPATEGPMGPTAVSNATLADSTGNASGVAVGSNATTTTQQEVSNILNDIRATETNQTEIAQVEAVLPGVVNALNQVGDTPGDELQIKYECVTTYDENGKRVSRTCTLTIGSDNRID